MIPNPSAVTILNLTGSNFESQNLDLTAFSGLGNLEARGVNIVQLALPNNGFDIRSIDVSENQLAKIPRFFAATRMGVCDFENCGMSEEQVDLLLADLDTCASTTINCDITGNSAPSQAGLDSITNIENRGGTVQHE